MRLRHLTVPTAALALALAGPAAPALAHGGGDVDEVVLKTVLVPDRTGTGTGNMTAVANLQYPQTGATSQSGSDIEFGRIGGRDYAFAGTLRNGMQIMDITDPAQPVRVGTYDCRISQGDLQVFPQGSRVLATYTADGTFGAVGAASRCGTDLGLVAGSSGTVIVDVTDPANPTSVGFAPVPRGSHNMTVHPGGSYLYNSNSDLVTSTAPTITIFDIKDPAHPRKVQDYRTPYLPTSLGSESHDITFNAAGTRAYSAALSQTLVLDTTDVENPVLISQVVDPAVQVVHGADPIGLRRADGTLRELLLVSDEQAGAATGTNCPGGGVHIYDITGALEKAPVKLGTWFIAETRPSTATCTAHVFRMHGDQGLFTIAWYDQGVRVVDVAGLADLPTPAVPFVTSGDGNGIKESGSYVFADSNTWSFKTNAIAADGSFFGYGNDLGRGFDVYRFGGLGRAVPALVPAELAPAAQPSPSPAPVVKGKGRGPKQGDALPVLLDGGSGPAAGALALLAGLVALTGVAAGRRHRDGLRAA